MSLRSPAPSLAQSNAPTGPDPPRLPTLLHPLCLPPPTQTERAGLWVLSNRYIAAAREAAYWLPRLKDQYKSHRTYLFLFLNGMSSVFEGCVPAALLALPPTALECYLQPVYSCVLILIILWLSTAQVLHLGGLLAALHLEEPEPPEVE